MFFNETINLRKDEKRLCEDFFTGGSMDLLKQHPIAAFAAAYLIIINIIGFAMAFSDKRKAEKGKSRISEPTLFFVSLIGGSIGMYISMKKFHHKTKQKRFMVGIPLIIVCQLAFTASICGYWLFV